MDLARLKNELEKLVKIMETLRGPEGCPWDRNQDYYSLQPYIIEEAYEVVEALQKKDLELLKEELGDLLLQVVFEAQIAMENKDFDLGDVIEGINLKLVRRHPHVFQDEYASTPGEVTHLWDEIKKTEKGAKKATESLLDRLSLSQPALNQAYEVQAIAAEVGFDWENTNDVIKKVEEEIAEVKTAIRENDPVEQKKEIGDLLFAVVNLARFCEVNPELALLGTILKFRERFKYIEERVKEKGQDIKKMTLEELDFYWEEAKKPKTSERIKTTQKREDRQ